MKKRDKNKDFSTEFVRYIFQLFHINLNKKIEHLCVQIFNFSIVGVVATVIDFLFLYFFRDGCHFSLILSNTLSFVISVMYNYWASMTFVFDVNNNKSRRNIFLVFILFSVIGLILNDIIVWFMSEKLFIYYLLSKVIATLLIMIFNFVTRKKFLE